MTNVINEYISLSKLKKNKVILSFWLYILVLKLNKTLQYDAKKKRFQQLKLLE